jgi:hypothetical protein
LRTAVEEEEEERSVPDKGVESKVVEAHEVDELRVERAEDVVGEDFDHSRSWRQEDRVGEAGTMHRDEQLCVRQERGLICVRVPRACT